MLKCFFFSFVIIFFGFTKEVLSIDDLSNLNSVSFEKMMGYGTPSWQYLKNNKDFQLLFFYKDIYEKKRYLHLSPTKDYKIPKIIHFIWLGPKNFPPESVANMRSWIAKHPDWTVKFWTDRKRKAPCNGVHVCLVDDFSFKKVKKYFDATNNFGEKSDLLRYEILLKEGGVYTDHDSNCLHPFDDFHKSYDFYGCLEQPHIAIDGFSVTVGNGLFGARDGHPILEETLDQVINRWDHVQKMYPQNERVHNMKRVQLRSYMALNLALHKKLGNTSSEDIIFPAGYFFADEDIPCIYSQHFYKAAWAKPFLETDFQKNILKKTASIKKKFSSLFMMGTFFLAGCICFSFLFWRKVK